MPNHSYSLARARAPCGHCACCRVSAQHALVRKPGSPSTRLLTRDSSRVGWAERQLQRREVKAPAKRPARYQRAYTASETLPERAEPPESLLDEDGSIQARRDFWLPVPGCHSLVPVPAHAVHATKPALCPPTRGT